MAFLAVAREEGEGRNCGNQESGVTGFQELQELQESDYREWKTENRSQKANFLGHDK